MKKFIVAFAAGILLISTTAMAGGKDKTHPAQATFQKEFNGATDVKWTEGKDVIAASFVLSESRVIAYFDHSGELLGTARSILFNQLPLAAIKEINKRYGSVPVYDIIEYSNGEETFYSMGIETATKFTKLKVSQSGDISVVQKLKR